MTNRSEVPKGWLEVGIKFGVPALIACYLVWILADKIELKLDHLVSTMSAHAAIGEHQSKALDRLILIGQQQCISQAKMAKRSEQECWK